MTDEQKQKLKNYLREYYKKYSAAKKLIISIIIKITIIFNVLEVKTMTVLIIFLNRCGKLLFSKCI